MIQGNRKLNMNIDGTEARTLEKAASALDGEKLSAKERRLLSSRLHRLVARYRLKGQVT